jgi:pimeloyl-ACP methyl ester carboxylesterase
VLVGHSNGVPVVRQFYRHHPDRTIGLVLVDGGLKRIEAPPGVMEKFLADLGGPHAREIAGDMIDQHIKPLPEHAEFIKGRMLATSPHTMHDAMLAAMDPAIWTEDMINVPVLALMAESPAWSPDYVAYARTIAPKMEWVTFKNVTHFVMIDAPEAFNARLNAFLDSNGL